MEVHPISRSCNIAPVNHNNLTSLLDIVYNCSFNNIFSPDGGFVFEHYSKWIDVIMSDNLDQTVQRPFYIPLANEWDDSIKNFEILIYCLRDIL